MLSVPPPALRSGGGAPFPLLVALTACGTLGMHMVIPALPATARALAIPAATAQLTITLYLVGLSIGQLVYGPLSDRFGRRLVLLAGMTLFAGAGAATALAPNAWVLLVARVLQSLGACSGLVLGRAIVRDSATADRAAARLALLTLTMSMAPAIAPAIGGYVTAWGSWRAPFGLLAVLGLAALIWSFLMLPETLARNGAGHSGSMLYSYARLLRSRVFCGYAIGGACSTTSFYAFMAASPFIFENLLHEPPEAIGLYYLLLMAGVAAGSLMANRMAGHVRLRTALRIANGLSITGALAFAALDAGGALSVAGVVGSVALFMVGAGMASPFAITGCVSVSPQTIGAASGLYGFVQMGYGMFCTILVEVWAPGSVYPVVTVMLGSALLGQAALSLAVWAVGREVR
jgi:DHA1 family bicyclomycin/chloramphenicol resistance-like MFS transporter